MQGNKDINYNISLSSEDVNLLIAELANLFKTAPSLRTTAPQLYAFTDMVNKLLARHDYSPQGIASVHAEMAKAQFKEKLLADLGTVVPSQQATPSPAPVEEAQNVSPIKKSRKKASGSEESGDAEV